MRWFDLEDGGVLEFDVLELRLWVTPAGVFAAWLTAEGRALWRPVVGSA